MKSKVILLRYGEMFLKGRNKSYFEKLLIDNIKAKLADIDCEFVRTQNRYYIENYDEKLTDEIVSRMKKVFGLHSLSIATKVETDYDLLNEVALEYAPDVNATFRITVNRADKSLDKNSAQIGADVGAYVLERRKGYKVDLHKPQIEIKIDIRERGYSYVFRDIKLCAQGMPVGCSGKGMLLLSGGFDSPVAGYRMARRGMQISAIHYHSFPYTSEQAKQKVVDLAQVLTDYAGNIKLFVVPFTEIQFAIHENCRADYMITIMRRIMIDIAERVAKENGCGALVTGESLGQVASQTLQSLTVTNDAVNGLPVFRPLIGMDKYEIMKTAEEIGTYKLSELPYQDCCTVFLPKNPVIKPSLDIAKKEQAKIENLEELIENAIKNIEITELRPCKE